MYTFLSIYIYVCLLHRITHIDLLSRMISQHQDLAGSWRLASGTAGPRPCEDNPRRLADCAMPWEQSGGSEKMVPCGKLM